MAQIKAGVNVGGIRSEVILALMVADYVYREFGAEMVITSVTDGKHGVGSLHYKGCAVDLRTRNILEEERQGLRDSIASRLGSQFDVVLEKDHLHIEFDPVTVA